MTTRPAMSCLSLLISACTMGCATTKPDLSRRSTAKPDASCTDTFYVSPDGNDKWSGTLPAPNAAKTDGPFATLARAQDQIRAMRDVIRAMRQVEAVKTSAHPSPSTNEHVRTTQEAAEEAGSPQAVTVLVRAGVYRIGKPIAFTPKDSGGPKGITTFAAYPGEKPVLSGGNVITGWKRNAGAVWTADIPEVKAGTWYFNQLFVNGRRRTRARTPNTGYLRTDGPLPGLKNPKDRKDPAARMGFRFKPGDIKRWDNLDDVVLFPYQSWTTPLCWIAALDEQNRTVRFTAPANWPFGYWEKEQRYYVENYLDALDAPGEWYLNRETGVVSYWPMPDEDMPTAEVVAPRLRKLVVFEGALKTGTRVRHIHLKGLTFEHADWVVESRGPADGQAAAWLEAAVFARGAENCLIEDCTIRHVGEYGVFFEQGCNDNRIVKCHIHDLGAGGVRIGHTDRTMPKDEFPSERNTVDNCYIHDGGHVFRAGVGVLVGRSSYNTVSHNEICDFDYTGISVGWSWGYQPSSAHHNTIEYNRVHNIGRGVLSDMGGIYTLGISPGTVIRNNIFHDIRSYAYGGWGLYTDEGSSGIVLENNIVYNTKTGGFHQHYGRENIVRNNVLAFSNEGQIQRTREEDHLSFTFERNIVYFNNGRLLSSNWKNGRYVMNHNVYWDTSSPEIAFAGMTFAQWQAKGFDKNSVIADPLFIDPLRFDFRLKPDSPAFKVGFQPIDASKIGLYGDPEWVALPRRLHPETE